MRQLMLQLNMIQLLLLLLLLLMIILIVMIMIVMMIKADSLKCVLDYMGGDIAEHFGDLTIS